VNDAFLGGLVEGADRGGDCRRSITGRPAEGDLGCLQDERFCLALRSAVDGAAAE
jgi:hypothetical protein